MKIINSIIMALFFACAVDASETKDPKVKNARIDILSGTVDLVPLKNVKHQPWVKDEERKKKTLMSRSKGLTNDEWNDYELEFTPQADGDISIYLRGMWYKPKGAEKNVFVWICYDNVKVTGANVINGSFEELKDDGTPVGWTSGDADMVVSDKATAFDGENYIKVHHNKPFRQKISVKQGQPVKITAKVKSLK